MYRIPLDLPTFVLENIPDDTGFTMSEKRSLRNAWYMIYSDVNKHAFEQSLRFLTENEDILDKFRNEHGQLRNRALHEHPLKVFDSLEALIFEGLESFPHMHGIINPIAIDHMRKNVAQEDIKKMTNHLSQYLKEVLAKVMSPTLCRAIDKICDIIAMSHE